jgi:ribonuclease Z
MTMTDTQIHTPSADQGEDRIEDLASERNGLTRREALKISGLALGGLALGGTLAGLLPDVAEAKNRCTPAMDCCEEDDQICDVGCCDEPDLRCSWTDPIKASRYSYFENLPKFYPFARTPSTIQPLKPNQMRITFMGTAFPPRNLAQRCVSIFVEVGWNQGDGTDVDNAQPEDQFVFDCGTGCTGSYNSMNVGFGRMNKIFLTHLHADHTGDLDHVYCFGIASDRKSPLWVWGPGASGVRNPRYGLPEFPDTPEYYDDGTAAFCSHLRDAYRWHTEAFSFQEPAYLGYPDCAPACDNPEYFGWATDPGDKTRAHRPAKPAGQYADDPWNDSYAMYPVELPFDWDTVEPNDPDAAQIVAYENPRTRAKITAFPVIHDRKGAIGYKLEWTTPDGQTLSMIFTGDTKPESLTLHQAKNGGKGVDVLIHEMALPPEVLVMKMAGKTHPRLIPDENVCAAKKVENSSHTPQGAFGYLLGQIRPYPGLTVATHFQAADDTIACAMRSLKAHLPKVHQGEYPSLLKADPRVTFAMDFMVVTVTPLPRGRRRIEEQRGVINPYGYSAFPHSPPCTRPDGKNDPAQWATPKYACCGKTGGDAGDPLAQISLNTAILPCDPDTGECNYRDDGY